MADYKWKPIEDLPEDWTKLASSELAGLASVWREHYETIKDSQALKQFNERLRREWAIETGIIENLYYIDRGVTLTLIEKGIQASLIPHGTTDKPAELIVPILKDQEEVVTGLFDFVGQQRQLSTSYIKQLHQALTQHQRTTAAKDSFGQMIEVELLRGDWKKLPNNPTKSDGSIHEYCPPEQVASEMDQLIAWHQEHLEKHVPPEVEAAWLHHRFTQIHPFQDGNGRMARTLASLIFLRAGLFPLVIHRDERDEYLDVLLEADFDSLKSLIELVSRTQKRAINQVLSFSSEILTEESHIQQIILAATNRLAQRKQTLNNVIDIWEKTKSRSTVLEQGANIKLFILSGELTSQLQGIDSYYNAKVEHHSGDHSAIFAKEAVQVAETLGYFANIQTYSSTVVLTINTVNTACIVISFHGLGKEPLGVMASCAFYVTIKRVDLNHSEVGIPVSMCAEAFQFTYNEPEEQVSQRFIEWLDEVVLNSLNYWQQQL